MYDCFGAGHSSTSVSAASGIAEADRLSGNQAHTVVVLGDGSFTGGMVHEALNNLDVSLPVIIVLNENEMSISKNIGRFAFATCSRTKSQILQPEPLQEPVFRLPMSCILNWRMTPGAACVLPEQNRN